jgi:dTDP-4-dehydrorhamnose 3,5-epimerase
MKDSSVLLSNSLEPRLIEGGISVDDRGEVSFVNGFSFNGIKRFYQVSNHEVGFVRAWHAHKKEDKYVFVSSGAAIVGAVKIDNWEKPSANSHISRFILSAHKTAILHIPSGYANGFKTLRPHTCLIFFSTSTVEESLNDDFRYDSRFWNPWDVIER